MIFQLGDMNKLVRFAVGAKHSQQEVAFCSSRNELESLFLFWRQLR